MGRHLIIRRSSSSALPTWMCVPLIQAPSPKPSLVTSCSFFVKMCRSRLQNMCWLASIASSGISAALQEGRRPKSYQPLELSELVCRCDLDRITMPSCFHFSLGSCRSTLNQKRNLIALRNPLYSFCLWRYLMETLSLLYDSNR